MATRLSRRTPPPEHDDAPRKRRCIRGGCESGVRVEDGLGRRSDPERNNGEGALPTPSNTSVPTATVGASRPSTMFQLSPSAPSVELPTIHPPAPPTTTTAPLPATTGPSPPLQASAQYAAVLAVGQVQVVRQDELHGSRRDPTEPIGRTIDTAHLRPGVRADLAVRNTHQSGDHEPCDGRSVESALGMLGRHGLQCDT